MTCERDAEIAELRAHLESLQNLFAQATSELVEIADRNDAIESLNERLEVEARSMEKKYNAILDKLAIHAVNSEDHADLIKRIRELLKESEIK